MKQNKTRPTKRSVPEFIAALTDAPRREDAQALIKLMQAATGDSPTMWGPSIIGFGSSHYVYESGREGDMPVIGFSPRKAATVLYGTIGFDGADRLLARLGPHSTGKGCLYIKQLAAIDAAVLAQLIAKAVTAKRGK